MLPYWITSKLRTRYAKAVHYVQSYVTTIENDFHGAFLGDEVYLVAGAAGTVERFRASALLSRDSLLRRPRAIRLLVTDFALRTPL